MTWGTLRQPCRSDNQEQMLAGTEEKSLKHISRTTRKKGRTVLRHGSQVGKICRVGG